MIFENSEAGDIGATDCDEDKERDDESVLEDAEEQLLRGDLASEWDPGKGLSGRVVNALGMYPLGKLVKEDRHREA